MRIASIDPGFNTGVAIAILHDKESIKLEKYLLGTFTNEPDAVVKLVLTSRSTICLMERKPRNAANSKTVPNEKIKAALGNLKIVEIGPGLWKPFMYSRLAKLEPWAPETQHEKDAMAILFYFLQTQNPKRKVKYV